MHCSHLATCPRNITCPTAFERSTGEWLQVLDLLTPQEMDNIYKFAVQKRKNFECFRPHLSEYKAAPNPMDYHDFRKPWEAII